MMEESSVSKTSAGDSGTLGPMVILVKPQEAKPVKEYLKTMKWIDKSLKTPPASALEGKIAFPLLEHAVPSVEAALEAKEPALAMVSSMERLSSSLEGRKVPPPQGKKTDNPAGGGSAPALHAVKGKKKKAPPQRRSFGDRKPGAVGGALPAPGAVRRVRCPPDADHAWFCKNVSDAREPVVLEATKDI